jgi:hypothetical protein
LLLRYQIAVSRVPLHVSETKCHLWTKHPDALNTIGDGVTVGVGVGVAAELDSPLAAELESPLASALESPLASALEWP